MPAHAPRLHKRVDESRAVNHQQDNEGVGTGKEDGQVDPYEEGDEVAEVCAPHAVVDEPAPGEGQKVWGVSATA